jgi:hypothetical protein
MDASVSVKTAETAELDDLRQSERRLGGLLHCHGETVVSCAHLVTTACRPTRASRWLRGGHLLPRGAGDQFGRLRVPSRNEMRVFRGPAAGRRIEAVRQTRSSRRRGARLL